MAAINVWRDCGAGMSTKHEKWRSRLVKLLYLFDVIYSVNYSVNIHLPGK